LDKIMPPKKTAKKATTAKATTGAKEQDPAGSKPVAAPESMIHEDQDQAPTT